jgi:hypothetical protein
VVELVKGKSDKNQRNKVHLVEEETSTTKACENLECSQDFENFTVLA